MRPLQLSARKVTQKRRAELTTRVQWLKATHRPKTTLQLKVKLQPKATLLLKLLLQPKATLLLKAKKQPSKFRQVDSKKREIVSARFDMAQIYGADVQNTSAPFSCAVTNSATQGLTSNPVSLSRDRQP